jgi:hypothetical protein
VCRERRLGPWHSRTLSFLPCEVRRPRRSCSGAGGTRMDEGELALASGGGEAKAAFSSQTKNFWLSNQQFDQMLGGLFRH